MRSYRRLAARPQEEALQAARGAPTSPLRAASQASRTGRSPRDRTVWEGESPRSRPQPSKSAGCHCHHSSSTGYAAWPGRASPGSKSSASRGSAAHLNRWRHDTRTHRSDARGGRGRVRTRGLGGSRTASALLRESRGRHARNSADRFAWARPRQTELGETARHSWEFPLRHRHGTARGAHAPLGSLAGCASCSAGRSARASSEGPMRKRRTKPRWPRNGPGRLRAFPLRPTCKHQWLGKR